MSTEDDFLRELRKAHQPLPNDLPEENRTKSFDQPNGEPSKRISHYKLLQKIADGGMGSVWMAEQLEPVKRRVALKLVKSGLDSRPIITRFEAERQALALMDHPSIAKILDGGTTEIGQPYFVMELVQGQPITSYCDKHKLSIPDRLQLFTEVCNAVQHAHQKGIIHRDLKPSNILVAVYDGKPIPKVIDFGLAKALDHKSKLTDKTLFTEFGAVVGTLQYMSPEQADLDAIDIDTRSDIYALGVLLYELLTGSTPIEPETIQQQAVLKVLATIRETDPPRPSARLSSSTNRLSEISSQRQIEPAKLQNELKGDLDWIVMRSLEKDRKRRYESANGFAEDITRYLQGDVVQARPPSAAYRIQKFMKKNRSLVYSSALVGAFLLFATVISVGFGIVTNIARRQAKESEQTANKERRKAEEEREKAEQLEEQARMEAVLATQSKEQAELALARSNFYLAQSRWKEKRTAEANKLLHSIPVKHRNFEWGLSRRLFEGSDATLYGHESVVTSVSYSPDGSRLATAAEDGVKIWDAKTGIELLALRGDSSGFNPVCFSPNGSHLASLSDENRIKIWDTTTGVETLTLQGHSEMVSSVCFSPDGFRIASSSHDKTIKLWDAAAGTEMLTLKGHSDAVSCVCFSPDGSRLASGSWDGSIKIWDTITGSDLVTLRAGISLSNLCFSPDGSRLAYPKSFEGIKVWETKTWSELPILKTDLVDDPRSLCFSPDGSCLAITAGDETIRLLDSWTGSEILKLQGHWGTIYCLCFSPDGSRLASGSWEAAKLWDTRTGSQLLSFGEDPTMIGNVIFSADGQCLAYTKRGNRISIWDAKVWKEILKLKGKISYDRDAELCLSPDSSSLAVPMADSTVKLWDTRNGNELQTFSGHTRPVTSLCFSSDGSKIASASGNKLIPRESPDSSIKIWDVRTGRVQHTLDARNVTCVRFNPDGSLLASGSTEPVTMNSKSKNIKIWDVKTGIELRSFYDGSGTVSSLSFSPDGSQLASAGFSIKLWDAGKCTKLLELKGHRRLVSCLCFSPDGSRLASGGNDTIKLWDVTTGEELLTLEGHQDELKGICFSRDGSRLVSWSRFGEVKIWDITTGIDSTTLPRNHDGSRVMCFSPDGSQGVSLTDGRTITLWNVSDGVETLTINGHSDDVSDVCFSPDGTKLATCLHDSTIKIWDAKTGKEIMTLHGHSGPIYSVCFSPDGSRIASGADDNSVKVWDAKTGHELMTLHEHSGPIESVSFSPDGARVLSKTFFDSERIIVEKFEWDANTGNLLNRDIDRTNITNTSSKFVNTFDNMLVLTYADQTTLINLDSARKPEVQGYREAKARLDPIWHRDQARELEQNQRWFAAAHHRAWQIQGSTNSVMADYHLRTNVINWLTADGLIELLPAVVSDALAKPSPSVFQDDDVSILDDLIWEIVKTPNERVDRLSVIPSWETVVGSKHHSVKARSLMELLRLAVEQGLGENSLRITRGALFYRDGQYQKAIEVLEEELEKLLSEAFLTDPAVLTFLALSYGKLGNVEKAKQYRAMFDERMKDNFNLNWSEYQGFEREINEVLGPPSAD